MKWPALAVVSALFYTLPASAILTVVPPDDALTGLGSYTGVVQLTGSDGGGICSGSLLWSGTHVLTAGHCPGFAGNRIRFETPSGVRSIDIINRYGYPGAFSVDISISELAAPAPLDATRYDIYRSADERGKIFDKAGFGGFGAGDGTFPPGTPGRRAGLNRFDMTLADFLAAPGLTSVASPGLLTLNGQFPGFDPEGVLLFDFDNGRAENDAAGVYFGLQDTGLGDREINTAGGDSGSPAFIDGKIAAVTSDGFTPVGMFADDRNSDLIRFEFFDEDAVVAFFNGFGGDGVAALERAKQTLINKDVPISMAAINNILSLDYGFGEFSTEIRISRYASWIDGIVGRQLVAEPAPLAIMLLGLGFILWRRTPRSTRAVA
jgi:hypothetical protein